MARGWKRAWVPAIVTAGCANLLTLDELTFDDPPATGGLAGADESGAGGQAGDSGGTATGGNATGGSATGGSASGGIAGGEAGGGGAGMGGVADPCEGAPCSEHGVCVVEGTGFRCDCASGYVRDDDDPNTCVPRCDFETDEGCDPLTRCIVTEPEGPHCTPCPADYIGTGETGCVLLPDCSKAQCGSGTCANLLGQAACVCPRGISGGACELRPQSLAAGLFFTCSLRSDGLLQCWGDPAKAIFPPPGTFKSVVGGDSCACGLDMAGAVHCWNPCRFSGSPTGLFKAISISGSHGCGILTDDRLACWGNNAQNQSFPVPAGTFRAVAVYGNYSCAIQTGGTLQCWGSRPGTIPTGAPGPYVALAAGNRHLCALNASGGIQCWGVNAGEQIDAPSGSFDIIAAGYDFSCAIRSSDRELVCWGAYDMGQADPPTGSFEAVSLGFSHGCALRTGGGIECWGTDENGEGTPPRGGMASVAVTDTQICAVGMDGLLDCWRTPGLARHPTTRRFASVALGVSTSCALRHHVEGLTSAFIDCWNGEYFFDIDHNYFSVVSGDRHICYIERPDQEVECQGSFPTTTEYSDALAAGSDHTCSIRQGDNTIGCWGFNQAQQATPPAGAFRHVTAGDVHSCAIDMAGEVVCWGDPALANAVRPDLEFSSLVAGGAYTCGLTSEGALHCWGPALSPLEATPPGSFRAVVARHAHVCAVRRDLALQCWEVGLGR